VRDGPTVDGPICVVRWIVDGMNLIGSRPDGWWRDRGAARRRLVVELGRFVGQQEASGADQAGEPPPSGTARTAGSVVVVFDGRWHADEVAGGLDVGVTVAFAPGGPDAADRVIAEMVRSSEDPAGTTVVTSDGALASQVRASGAVVLGVAAFGSLLRG